jgi:hypothetical protein
VLIFFGQALFTVGMQVSGHRQNQEEDALFVQLRRPQEVSRRSAKVLSGKEKSGLRGFRSTTNCSTRVGRKSVGAAKMRPNVSKLTFLLTLVEIKVTS